uniref:tRNA/rRNA methyltransferase SpoU type domain-containing protein n=1 Tax=Chrysotila carterae TaxID=13221 RepID=A0A7S4B5M6_CHRCT|mmetsp:Transcript_37859/g.79580  ORF Transcript_37859/g.79580 Transcript_37859/m.79580 type:complete len:313 (-) Transcript_37859:444-1382(-)
MQDALALLLASFRVICVSPSQGGNVGMAARACANFECGELALVAPDYDRLSEAAMSQERRFATQEAGLRVVQDALVFDSLEDALRDCSIAVGFTRRRGVMRSASSTQVTVGELAALSQTAAGGRTALVFGREADGLRSSELLQCTHTCEIPTSANHGSMNLAASITFALGRCFEEKLALEGASGHPLGADRTFSRAALLRPSSGGRKDDAEEIAAEDDLPTSLQTATIEDIEHLMGRFLRLADPEAAAAAEAGEQATRWVRTARGSRAPTEAERNALVLKRIVQRARLSKKELRVMHNLLKQAERQHDCTPK